MGDLVSLLLYALQQLGVMLGVGAETILLLSYLLSMRDGRVDATEDRFARAVGKVLDAGLFLIVGSGAIIATTHFLAGQFEVLFAPVFLFKWVLIGIVFLCAFFIQKNIISAGKGEALAGATWYALFIIHILAPITTWANLIILYVLWVGGFSLCWWGLTRFTRSQKLVMQGSLGLLSSSKTAQQARPSTPAAPLPPPVVIKKPEPPKPPPPPPPPPPKPIPPPPPPPPKPVPPPPPPKPLPPPPPPKPIPAPIIHSQIAPAKEFEKLPLQKDPLKPNPITATPAQVLAPKPAPAPVPPTGSGQATSPHIEIKDVDSSPFLPKLHVMPKTPEDVEKHKASVTVK